MDTLIKLLFLVNPDFALLVVSNILLLGLKIFLKILFNALTDMSFLLSLNNVVSSFSMTELYFQNLLLLLILFLNINFNIHTKRIKELNMFLNLPISFLLSLMSFIMDLSLLFILLGETSSGILIYMLLFLLVDLINLSILSTSNTLTSILLLDNGNFMSLILFLKGNILTITSN